MLCLVTGVADTDEVVWIFVTGTGIGEEVHLLSLNCTAHLADAMVALLDQEVALLPNIILEVVGIPRPELLVRYSLL
jgi:hypothetical protein